MKAWMDLPIPARSGPTALGYGHVPVVESGEPLVRLSDYGLAGAPWYALPSGNPPYGRPIPGAALELAAREGVAERLVDVDRRLSPLGFRLFILDAWRPVACQRGLWDWFWAEMRAADPRADEATLRARTGQFVSDPSRFDPADSSTWPTHSTGGAVDLTLTRDGVPVDMGTPFDDASPRSHAAALEGSATPATRHRRLLHHAMVEAGFTPYTFEWWHFDLGTQLAIAGWCHAAPPPSAARYAAVEAVTVRSGWSPALVDARVGAHR